MRGSALLTRLLYWLGMSPDPARTPTGARVDPPLSHTGGEYEHIDVALYETRLLHDDCGDAPEQTVGQYAHRALADAGIDHRVLFGFDPLDVGAGPQIKDFIQAEKPYTAGDVNLLLTSRRGSGASFVGGKWGWMGCGRIDRVLTVVPAGMQRIDGNVHGALHEIAHQLGARHDEIHDEPGPQYPGVATRTSRWYWERTPMAGGSRWNACGEPVDARPREPGVVTVRRQRYAGCTVQFMTELIEKKDA